VKKQRFFPSSRQRDPFHYSLRVICAAYHVISVASLISICMHTRASDLQISPVSFISNECYARVAQLALIYVSVESARSRAGTPRLRRIANSRCSDMKSIIVTLRIENETTCVCLFPEYLFEFSTYRLAPRDVSAFPRADSSPLGRRAKCLSR